MFPRRFFQKSTRVSSSVAEPDVISPEVSAATTTATTTTTTTSPEGQDEAGREKEVAKGIGRDQVCSLFSSAVFCVCVRLRARDLKSDLSTSLDLTRYQSTRHRPPQRQTATACAGRFVLDSFGNLNASDGIRIQFRLS
jgi:hypothetical protein